MKQNYFVYNNKAYYSGTIVVMSGFDCVMQTNKQTEMTFCYYLSEYNTYVCKTNNAYFNYKSNNFYAKLLSVTNKTDVEYVNFCLLQEKLKNKPMTFVDELNIDGMFIAWIWYVLIMGAAVIFKDMLSIWICASIIFFSYRAKKLKGGVK